VRLKNAMIPIGWLRRTKRLHIIAGKQPAYQTAI
jgi:hypothetical protein